MFVGSWHFVNLGTMSWGFVRWFKESLCPVQPDLLLKLQVKLFQVWPRSVAASLTGSRRMKMVHALSCAFMCFHVLCFVIWRLRETGGMKEWFDQDLESSKQHQTHNLQFFGGIKMDHCSTVLRFYRVFFFGLEVLTQLSSLKSTDVRVADVTSFILEDLLAGQTQGFMKACGSSLRK